VPRLTPEEREHADRGGRVEQGGAEREVSQREDRHRQGERQPEPRLEERRNRSKRRQAEGPTGRIEGDRPGGPECEHAGQRGRHEPWRHGGNGQGLTPAFAGAPLPPGEPECAGERGSVRAPRGIQVEGSTHRGEHGPGQVRPHRLERRRTVFDRACRLEQGAAPERVPAGQRLPEHHADSPDVRRLGCLRAGEALRSDVRQGARNVALSRQRLRLLDLREPEVEHADRDARAFGEQDVRRLDVAVHDAALMCMREPVEDLNRGFDRRRVVELAAAHRLAERSARNVLIRDVHGLRIPAEAVGTLARRMPQARRRLRLALRSRGRLSLARDDLQRDVKPVLFVTSEPDRP